MDGMDSAAEGDGDRLGWPPDMDGIDGEERIET